MRRTPLLALLLTAASCAAQWQILDAHTTADLRGIDNVGHGIAWASGSDGTILRTEDGGLMWQLCAKPPGGEHLDFRGIQAFDNNTAIIMSSGKGDLSRLYKTTDGCQTWELVFTNPDEDGFWDALRFLHSTDYAAPEENFLPGVLIGDPVDGKFPIFVSRDVGSTWTRWNENDPKHSPGARVGEELFAASNQALVFPGNTGSFAFVTGGDEPRIYLEAAHDRFSSSSQWLALASARLPFPSGPSAGAFAIAAERKRGSPWATFVIVGGDYEKPNIAGTAVSCSCDGSVILPMKLHAATTPPHGYRSAVAYDAPTKTWITVGPNGTDVSTDDGRNWRALHPDPKFNEAPDADQHWNALSLPFVVGPHGRIGLLRPLTHPVK